MLNCGDYDIFEHLRFILFSRKEISDVAKLNIFMPDFGDPLKNELMREKFRLVIFIDYHLKYCLPTKKDIADCKSLLRLRCNNIDNTCVKITDFYRNEMKYNEKLVNYRTKSFFKGLLTFIYNWESLNLFPYYVSLLPIPVNKILDYKLAICTEFAKLTSSVLYQLYSDCDVFLFFTSEHVAAGLLADNDFLIIDQECLFNLENWIQEQQKKGHCYVSVYFLNNKDEEIKLVFQQWISIKNGKLIYSTDIFNWKEYCAAHQHNYQQPC
jgi:hypothetical protein